MLPVAACVVVAGVALTGRLGTHATGGAPTTTTVSVRAAAHSHHVTPRPQATPDPTAAPTDTPAPTAGAPALTTAASGGSTPSGTTVTPTPRSVLPGGPVVTYDRTPGAVTDPSYALFVNAQPIAVDRMFDTAVARFAFSGNANVVVVASQPVSSFGVSPRSYGIAATPGGNTLSFSLTTPHNLIVTVNGLPRLYILADPLESNPPAPNGPGVVNLASYVSDNTGATLQTAQFQSAINAAASRGAVLYVPDGKYLVGSLQMKSNMGLYLQSGALIQGSSNPSDYVGGALIRTSAAGNARIFGRGVIDAAGSALRPAGSKSKVLRVNGGQGVTVDDVLLRDSPSWSVHVEAAAHVALRNLRIVNNQALGVGLDGIDTDSSSDVTVSGAFVSTSDDCFPVKTTATANQPANGITVQGSVCWTQKSALKIGTESTNAISNVTFAGNNVVHADRALAIYLVNGGSLQNVTYSDNFSEVVGGDAKQRLVDFVVSAGQASNIRVINYTAYSDSPSASLVQGTAGNPLAVTFTNLRIAGRHCLSLADARMTASNAVVTFTP
jgi:hypothetical protein